MPWLSSIAFALVVLAAGGDDMASIPAGEFTMGRTKMTSDDKTNMRPHVLLDDTPARTVTIHAFKIDKYEVTNAKYFEFVLATKRTAPYHWLKGKFSEGSANAPVYNVDWEDANAYCHWAGERLATEAEWERAARGGLDKNDYPWGEQANAKQARFNVGNGPGPVGQFPPNGFGVFDMAGNVSEWTADWFDGEYYRRGENVDPHGPATGEYKVIRGGAWSDSGKRITVFFRNWTRPNQRTPNLGFRCAQ
jgi:sulfatase modifying factor 1